MVSCVVLEGLRLFPKASQDQLEQPYNPEENSRLMTQTKNLKM